MQNTLRPKGVLAERLRGLVGVTSTCDVGEEENNVDWGFIHSSQSCVILFKAVFSRSESYIRIKSLLRYQFQFKGVPSMNFDTMDTKA